MALIQKKITITNQACNPGIQTLTYYMADKSLLKIVLFPAAI